MPLFDAYIMVDWSAAAKPTTGANSIWVGVLAKDARLKHQYQGVNIDTRVKARDFIEQMCTKLTGRGDRVLLGFDFSLGYPAGTAEAMGLQLNGQAPWQAMHAHLANKLKDKADNSNARFAIAAGMNYAISQGPFPFWGAPKRDQVSTLSGTKPDFDETRLLLEYRIVEQHMRDARTAAPKSVWQLAYTGSVGSQSLMGIPHIHGLRQTLDGARIWPFEVSADAPLTEDTLEDTKVVIAEIYPSLVKANPESGEVLDAAQVRAIAYHYRDMDANNRLAGAFQIEISPQKGNLHDITQEEGWILGI